MKPMTRIEPAPCIVPLVAGPSGLSGRDKREVMAGKAGPRPPVEATHLDVYAPGGLEDRGVAVSTLIDPVSGSISPHRTECARPVCARTGRAVNATVSQAREATAGDMALTRTYRRERTDTGSYD